MMSDSGSVLFIYFFVHVADITSSEQCIVNTTDKWRL